MSYSIHTVLFSKDRPMQLEACLESMYQHLKADDLQVSIIYRATDSDFFRGYEKLKDKYSERSDISWIDESLFAHSLHSVLKDERAQKDFTMFLVDDIIFTADVSTSDKQFDFLNANEQMLAVSLRLHEGVKHCYATNEDVSVPSFVKGCVWNWYQASGDWAYPMSVDGNVYRTSFIIPICLNLTPENPNKLEASLAEFASSQPDMPKYMCCYTEAPRLINIPENRVQSTFPNRCLDGYSADEINNLYLENKKIDVNHYKGVRPISVHVPFELEIVDAVSAE